MNNPATRKIQQRVKSPMTMTSMLHVSFPIDIKRSIIIWHRKPWPSRQNDSAYVPRGRDKGRDRFVALQMTAALK